MRVLSLELANFRNYAALKFEPPGGACVLVGANAQGKSNLLEALGLLAIGKSFRASRESDVVTTGAPAASVGARVRTRHGDVSVSCLIVRNGDSARKRFALNGRTVPYAEFLGGIAAVTFIPSDLQLASGPGQMRRRLLNTSLSQSNRAYYRDLLSYAKVLSQKNALLRAPGAPDRVLLRTYNGQLSEAGSRIVCARAAYVRLLAAKASAIHATWVGPRPELRVRYAPLPPQADESPAAVLATLEAALEKAAAAEAARTMTLVGPHRDDLQLSLDAESLARYGSQGQQRTAVLALKSAEYALLLQAAGEAPLLLLDDVLSELDGARRRAFLESIAQFEQAFITSTEFPELPAGAAASAMLVSGGTLTPIELPRRRSA